MISKHDELLLNDLERQPLWLLILYLIIGIASIAVGIMSLELSMPVLLCTGGGLLFGLGIEKLISRRVRRIAAELRINLKFDQ